MRAKASARRASAPDSAALFITSVCSVGSGSSKPAGTALKPLFPELVPPIFKLRSRGSPSKAPGAKPVMPLLKSCSVVRPGAPAKARGGMVPSQGPRPMPPIISRLARRGALAKSGAAKMRASKGLPARQSAVTPGRSRPPAGRLAELIWLKYRSTLPATRPAKALASMAAMPDHSILISPTCSPSKEPFVSAGRLLWEMSRVLRLRPAKERAGMLVSPCLA